MYVIGLVLITAGVLVIIYAMQDQSPFNLKGLAPWHPKGEPIERKHMPEGG